MKKDIKVKTQDFRENRVVKQETMNCTLVELREKQGKKKSQKYKTELEEAHGNLNTKDNPGREHSIECEK